MALLYGHTSLIDGEFEGTYGTAPSGNWKRLPMRDFDPGVSEDWLRQDIINLAGGRNEPTPIRNFLEVRPRVTVPVDLVNIGHWLRLMMGAPSTSGSTNFTHTYTLGAATLPSISLQHHNASLDANPFMLLRGMRAVSMEIPFRFGEEEQSASLSLVGTNAARASSTAAGTPTAATFTPFTGAVGVVQRAGSALARVTGATLRMTNGLEVLREGNRASASITEAAPGNVEVTGTMDVRMDTDRMLQDGEGSAPVELMFGFELDSNRSLTFTVEAAYVNRIMPPVRGRSGIQATFAFRGVFDASSSTSVTAVLKNQTATYA